MKSNSGRTRQRSFGKVSTTSALGRQRGVKTDPCSVTEQWAAELGTTVPFVDKPCFVPRVNFVSSWFVCVFHKMGLPQSSHEVVLQSKWNLGIAVLITEVHCQDSQTLVFFLLSLYMPSWTEDLSAFFQHNLHLFGDCSWALFHQPHLPVPPRSCWADEQVREEGAGMWNKDPGERWNDEDSEQNERQASEGILGAAPDPGPDEWPSGSS